MKLFNAIWKVQLRELFIPGMMVERIQPSHRDNNIGEVLTVKEERCGLLYFEEKTYGYHPSRFRKAIQK